MVPGRSGIQSTVAGTDGRSDEPRSWGEEKWETAEQKAGRIVAENLRKRHWTEAELEQRSKTDATKVEIALRLRRETMMTLEWIAEGLRMGCPYTVANCLKAARNQQ